MAACSPDAQRSRRTEKIVDTGQELAVARLPPWVVRERLAIEVAKDVGQVFRREGMNLELG
jgi:hypothetical protein